MFFYLSELLFSGFLQLKDNSKNNSKHRDKVPLSLKFGVFVSVVREVPTPLGISEKCLIFFLSCWNNGPRKLLEILTESWKIHIKLKSATVVYLPFPTSRFSQVSVSLNSFFKN